MGVVLFLDHLTSPSLFRLSTWYRIMWVLLVLKMPLERLLLDKVLVLWLKKILAPIREFFLEDGAGFRNPSFAEFCHFLRKRRVIHKRPNPGTVKFWQKMGREIAVLSYPTYWKKLMSWTVCHCRNNFVTLAIDCDWFQCVLTKVPHRKQTNNLSLSL